MERFHDAEYVRALLNGTDDPETHGLEDDCPIFSQLSDFVLWNAGATLTAVEALSSGECDVAMHWHGGRHHAQSY